MLIRTRMMGWMLIAGLCVAVTGAGTVRAGEPKELLKLVPEDAWGFVMLRSLSTIDDRASELQKMLNLPIPGQLTPMALMALQIMPNEENPLDMKSPMCLVVMDVQKYGTVEGAPFPDPSNAVVVIAPAKDGEALLKKLSAEEAKEGICKCKVTNQDAFAALKEKHVILGKNKDCVMRALKSTKSMADAVPAARMKVATDSDIYVSIAVGALMDAYKDVISGYMQGMGAVMGSGAKELEKVQKMIAQMKAFDLAVNLDKDGFSVRYLVEAQADSDLEKMMKDVKTSSESLLAMLPKEKYLFAFGSMGGYSESAEKFGDPNMVANLIRQMQIEGVDEKAVKEIDGELLKILKNMGQVGVSVSALPEGPGGMFGLTMVLETKDADGFMAGVRSIWNNAWKLSPNKEVSDVKEHFVHKADAEEVGGGKADTITLKIKEMADKFEWDEDDMKNFESILGKEVVFRFGAADSKHIVCTFGGGKARHESACKAMKAGKSGSLASDKGITDLSGRLPNPRTAEGYFAVDNILHTVKAIAKVVGEEEEVPFEVPAIDAPLAICTTHDGGIQRGDLYVPTKLIVAVKKMIDDQMKADAMSEFDEDDEGSDKDKDDDSSDEDSKDSDGGGEGDEDSGDDSEDE